jgi:hypothetical protein
MSLCFSFQSQKLSTYLFAYISTSRSISLFILLTIGVFKDIKMDTPDTSLTVTELNDDLAEKAPKQVLESVNEQRHSIERSQKELPLNGAETAAEGDAIEYPYGARLTIITVMRLFPRSLTSLTIANRLRSASQSYAFPLTTQSLRLPFPALLMSSKLSMTSDGMLRHTYSLVALHS